MGITERSAHCPTRSRPTLLPPHDRPLPTVNHHLSRNSMSLMPRRGVAYPTHRWSATDGSGGATAALPHRRTTAQRRVTIIASETLLHVRRITHRELTGTLTSITNRTTWHPNLDLRDAVATLSLRFATTSPSPSSSSSSRRIVTVRQEAHEAQTPIDSTPLVKWSLYRKGIVA